MIIPSSIFYKSSLLSPLRFALNQKLFEDSIDWVTQQRYHKGTMVVALADNEQLPFVYKCPHNTWIDRVFLFADSVAGTYTVDSTDHTLSISTDQTSTVDTTITLVAPNTVYTFTPSTAGGSAIGAYLVIHTRSDRWTPVTNEIAHSYEGFYPTDQDVYTKAEVIAASGNLRTASLLPAANRLAVVPYHFSFTNFSSARGTFSIPIPNIDTAFGQGNLVAITLAASATTTGPVLTVVLKNEAGATQDTFTITQTTTSEVVTEAGLNFLLEDATPQAQGTPALDWSLEISSNSASITRQLNFTLWYSNY